MRQAGAPTSAATSGWHRRGAQPREGTAPLAKAVWAGALGAFVVAGAAGVVLRVGLVTGLPEPLAFDNLRHAHSHLMYFGWVTPPLMVLLAHLARTRGGDVPGAERIALLALAAGAAAFPAFLASGYHAVEVAGLRVPLSVLIASANGAAWFAFVWRWARHTRPLPRDRALRLADGAVALLALAPLGALARGLVDAAGASATAGAAAIAAFLSWFGDGWLLLGVLALAWGASPGDERRGRWGQRMLMAGLPTAFLVHITPADLPSTALRVGATTGGLLLAVGLLTLAAALWQPAGAWRPVLVLAVAVALLRAAAALPIADTWLATTDLRILGLHVVALGVVTVGIVTAAHAAGGPAAVVRPSSWIAASAVLLLTLLPAAGAAGPPGTASLALAAVGSVPLVAVAATDLARLIGPAVARRPAVEGAPHGP